MVENQKPVVFGTFEDTNRVPGSPESKEASGETDSSRGRPMISPDSNDDDDFPDRDERQKNSRRHYCC